MSQSRGDLEVEANDEAGQGSLHPVQGDAADYCQGSQDQGGGLGREGKGGGEGTSLVGWLVSRSFFCFVFCFVGCLLLCLFNCLSRWLVGWLVSCLVGELFGW